VGLVFPKKSGKGYKLRSTSLQATTSTLGPGMCVCFEDSKDSQTCTGHLFSKVKLTAGVRGGAVGWGTALQAGRSRVRFPMVSLEFFIDIILLVALWPWGQLSL
jgi:hypothetical protein